MLLALKRRVKFTITPLQEPPRVSTLFSCDLPLNSFRLTFQSYKNGFLYPQRFLLTFAISLFVGNGVAFVVFAALPGIFISSNLHVFLRVIFGFALSNSSSKGWWSWWSTAACCGSACPLSESVLRWVLRRSWPPHTLSATGQLLVGGLLNTMNRF